MLIKKYLNYMSNSIYNKYYYIFKYSKFLIKNILKFINHFNNISNQLFSFLKKIYLRNDIYLNINGNIK